MPTVSRTPSWSARFSLLWVGNSIGAPLAGHISDRTVRRLRALRGGTWVPEDRLRACLWGCGLLVPMSVLLVDIITTFVPGKLGIALNLVMLFCNGVGVISVLSPINAYNVDVLHERSAESVSASSGLRALVIALSTTLIISGLERFGLLWLNAGAAALAWVGIGLMLATIRYGDRMRGMVDLGWSTARDN